MDFVLIASAAAGEDGGESSNALLSVSPGLMIWTLVTFLLALYFLNKYAFGPIQKAIEGRRDSIAASVDAAEQIKIEADKVLADYRAQLAEARSEADGMIERARKTGDELTARVKTESEAIRQEQLAQTQQQVAAEVEKAMGDLRSAVAEMTVTAAEKVLRGSLDSDKHQQLIEQAVEDLDFSKLEKVGAGS